MTKVSNRTSGSRLKGDSTKSPTRMGKERTSAAQIIAPDPAFTMQPRLIPREPTEATDPRSNTTGDLFEYATDPDPQEHGHWPKSENAMLSPAMEPIEFVGDGVGVVPLSDEEAKAPLGVPINYIGEENEWYATYSIEQAACELNVRNFVVQRWIDSGRLVSMVDRNGDLRIPQAQIRNGQIAPYLEEIRQFFSGSVNLWQYLVTEFHVENEMIRPIDIHFQNNLELALMLPYSVRTDFN